jgi:hypothetical protein
MSADDKLDILKEMIALVGSAVLQGDHLLQFQSLCGRYDEIASKPAPAKRTAKAKAPETPLPDIYEPFNAQQRSEFIDWAAALGIPILKRIVKAEQFDPAGRSQKWRKAEKFAELIYEQLESRTGRGSGFGRISGAQ